MLLRRMGAIALGLLAALADAQDVASSTIDEASTHCYELPVVVITALDRSFPDATCNQRRYPAEDCLKAPVRVRVEILDGGESVDTFAPLAEGATAPRPARNCFDPSGRARSSPVTHAFEAESNFRGQTSLFFPKHQLNLKFSSPTSLLGLPPDSAFVLNGPFLDCSLLRNHLAHWLFRGTGRYSPRSRHAAVYLKASAEPDAAAHYAGVYLLLEKLSYGRHRVNLAALGSGADAQAAGELGALGEPGGAPRDACARDLSGGWAWQNDPLAFGAYSPNVVVDAYQNEFGMGERPLLAHPSGAALSQRQRDYFVNTTTGFLPRFYRALWHNLSSAEELARHADLGSFADYLLHTEMSLNVDAYRRSTFFFKDRGQPINAGPVWDLNLAYGNGARRDFRDWIFPQYTFWKRLMCHHRLAALVIRRWKTLRGELDDDQGEGGAAGAWSDASIRRFLAASAAPLGRQMDRCRAIGGDWRGDVRQCASVSLRACNGSFAEQVDALEAAVLARARWMDAHITQLFKPLDAATCSGVGDVPAFNCAADGDDGGCVDDPEPYYSRVAFPPVRRPAVDAEDAARCAEAERLAAEVEAPAPLAAYDAPSKDDCWRSAGLYVYPEQKGVRDKSLTLFCNGYGSCPQGPGAECTCADGVLVEDKTCRRIDAEMVTRKPAAAVVSAEQVAPASAPASASSPVRVSIGASAVVAVAALGVAAVGVVGVSRQLQLRRRRRQARLGAFRPVSYGSAQDAGGFLSSPRAP